MAEMAQQQQQAQQMIMTAMEQLAARLGQLEVQGNAQPAQRATTVQHHQIATPVEAASPEASPPEDPEGSCP
eukprot:4755785-Alexandrium_andersonii.AAC.1